MFLPDIIKIAQSKARQSACRYRVSAVGLDKHGKVIGCTFNRQRFSMKGGGIHAEIRLMQRYKQNLKSIFICRVSAKGTLLKIEPCENCRKIAKKLGIKIYSIGE